MPDVPDYAQGIRHKQRAYAANRIPALFIYPLDLQGPAWPDRLAGRIYQATRAARCYAPRYRSAGRTLGYR
jgi:hypothetical protein